MEAETEGNVPQVTIKEDQIEENEEFERSIDP